MDGPSLSLGIGKKSHVQQKLAALLQQMLHLHGPVARLQEALSSAAEELRNRAASIRLSRAVGSWGITQADHPLRGEASRDVCGLPTAYSVILEGDKNNFATV